MPPPMREDHPCYKKIRGDPRYKDGPTPEEFPDSECLERAVKRLIPYWQEIMVPQILENKKLLIVSHGSLLKGLVMYLDNMSKDDLLKFHIPNSIPFVYKLDENLKPVVSLKYM